MTARSFSIAVLVGSVALTAGCQRKPSPEKPKTTALAASPPPWSNDDRPPAVPAGMVWIPPGPLVAGTPPMSVPRIADEEMPGEQVMLDGFFIDTFAYPNEEGAIPETGVDQDQAARLCAERGKRLCSELEWERACKGPRNLTYEYGYRYRSEPCQTGSISRMLPSGYRSACKSEFGVRDMHGGVWEWTSSRWGRSTTRAAYATRGGNSTSGEVVGRCANAVAREPASRGADLGFRCCKGDVRPVEVSLHIESGPKLVARGGAEHAIVHALEALVPDSVTQTLAGYGKLQLESVWDWRPLGNEKLVAGGGCAGGNSARRCGVIVARFEQGNNEALAWVSSGLLPPVVRVSQLDSRKLFVYGGDRITNFRQSVVFDAGRLRLNDVERKLSSGEYVKAKTPVEP
jgi:formylglycine-generating enzyme